METSAAMGDRNEEAGMEVSNVIGKNPIPGTGQLCIGLKYPKSAFSTDEAVEAAGLGLFADRSLGLDLGIALMRAIAATTRRHGGQ
jgi:hypothetical protein